MDYRRTHVLVTLTLLISCLWVDAWGQDTFTGDGVILSDPSTTQDEPYAIALDADAIYLAGVDGVPGAGRWRIEKRSRSDGALVAGFGAGGVATSDPSATWDVPRALATDGTALYVAGDDASAGPAPFYPRQWRVEKRSLMAGALIPSFGSGGVVTTNPSSGHDIVYAVALDQGALYLVGSGGSGWRVEKRSRTDGAVVAGFGLSGAVTSAGGEPYGAAIAGNALVVGGSNDFANWRIEKRSLADGALQYAITEAFTDVGCGPQGVFALAADTAFVYLAGQAAGGWRVEKRQLSDGSPVWAQTLPSSGSCDGGRGITLDATAAVIVGRHGVFTPWRIEKRSLTDGLLVPTFGSAGVVTSGGFISAAYAVALDAGLLYVAGSQPVAGSNDQWRIERRSAATGALVLTPGGTTTTSTSTTTTLARPVSCAPIDLRDCRISTEIQSADGPGDRFSVSCLATLDDTSNGIDPAREGLQFLLGDDGSCIGACFAQTVAPIRTGKCWRWAQRDRTAQGLQKVKLCERRRGVYRLTASSRRADLGCLEGVPGVGLRIGDDCTCPNASPGCGDGEVQPGEECDPPGELCENGLECTRGCTCPEPQCGDGTINQDREDCDPPGDVCDSGGPCRSDCTCGPVCGDEVVQPPAEQCDPPGDLCANGLECTDDCLCPEPRCGDGVINRDGEQCDGDPCDTGADCTDQCTCAPICGDGIINVPGEECEAPGDSVCPYGHECTDECKCPRPCSIRCCDGYLEENVPTMSPEECMEYASAVCGGRCRGIRHVNFNTQRIYTKEDCVCCTLCGKKFDGSGNPFTRYRVVEGVCAECTTQATNTCHAQDRRFLDAKWGQRDPANGGFCL